MCVTSQQHCTHAYLIWFTALRPVTDCMLLQTAATVSGMVGDNTHAAGQRDTCATSCLSLIGLQSPTGPSTVGAGCGAMPCARLDISCSLAVALSPAWSETGAPVCVKWLISDWCAACRLCTGTAVGGAMQDAMCLCLAFERNFPRTSVADLKTYFSCACLSA